MRPARARQGLGTDPDASFQGVGEAVHLDHSRPFRYSLARMDSQSGTGRLDIVWEAERARRTLETGIIVFRWAAFAWMVVLTIVAEPFRRPLLVWVVLATAGLWSLWLTPPRNRSHPVAAWLDLAVAVGLILMAGMAIQQRGLLGDAPFYVTAYSLSAILVWGSRMGVVGGLAAGLIVGAALLFSRPLNGVAFAELSKGQVQGLATSLVLFLTGGGTVGLVARLLDASARQIRDATETSLAARERAARLAEREAIARRIHDSVLQALTLINKRARELEEQRSISAPEVGDLARMAAEQERVLRALVARHDENRPVGMTSLREAVEEAVGGTREIPVEISGLGAVWLPAGQAAEVGAAVRQALENVVQHAEATRVTVHVEADDGWASVSIRDDGRGFRYDEQAFRTAGKLGIVSSMKGRIEELGGTMSVDTAPGAGTEVELRVPIKGTG